MLMQKTNLKINVQLLSNLIKSRDLNLSKKMTYIFYETFLCVPNICQNAPLDILRSNIFMGGPP